MRHTCTTKYSVFIKKYSIFIAEFYGMLRSYK